MDRIHRLLLDVIEFELDRLGVQDLNGLQALLLSKFGTDEILTIGELSSRGHYGVFKATYNVRKLVKFGYVEYKPLKSDGRSAVDRADGACVAIAARFSDACGET